MMRIAVWKYVKFLNSYICFLNILFLIHISQTVYLLIKVWQVNLTDFQISDILFTRVRVLCHSPLDSSLQKTFSINY